MGNSSDINIGFFKSLSITTVVKVVSNNGALKMGVYASGFHTEVWDGGEI